MRKIFLIAISGLLLAGCYHTGTTVPVEKTEPVVQEKATEEAQTTDNNTVVFDNNGVTYGNTIIYDDNGLFTPKIMTVKAGTSVTWKNSGNKTMWVASAVHPTHQELPGFDQLQTVGNGGSYSYTFTKAGIWKYHNHVSPGETGIVIVEE